MCLTLWGCLPHPAKLYPSAQDSGPPASEVMLGLQTTVCVHGRCPWMLKGPSRVLPGSEPLPPNIQTSVQMLSVLCPPGGSLAGTTPAWGQS